MPLGNKVFYTFIVLIIVPLIIVGIAVHVIFSNAKVEEVTLNTEKTINQANQNMDLLIEDASRTSLSILYNRQLLNILRKYDNGATIYRNSTDAKEFTLFLSGIMYKRDSIYGVHVFTNNGDVFSHMSNNLISHKVDLESEKWFKSAKEKHGSWNIYPEEYPNYYVHETNKMVSLARIIRDPIDHKEIGVIKIDFSEAFLKQLTSQSSKGFWDVRLDGALLFKSEKNELIEKCVGNRSWIKDENGEKYLCITNTSKNTNVEFSYIIPKEIIYKEINNFDFLLLSLVLIVIFLSLVLSYYTTKRLMKPLENLKEQVVKMHRDTNYDDEKNNHKGDIGLLSGLYDEMFDEIVDLFDEIYQLQIYNAESEYRALQSRMDPHFMFNTLESINMIAIKNKQFEISDMIVELGKLIRYRLKSEEPLVHLNEEVIFSKTYLSIMMSRMTESILVDWQIDNSLLHHKVPKYIIQPLIENALTHGYGEGIIELVIKVIKDNNKISISVSDNGVGISEESLLYIHQRINSKSTVTFEKSEKGSGIALDNIRKRLHLTYASKGELFIKSEKGMGTTVTIIIPIGGE